MKGFLFDENLPRVPSLQTGLPVTHALDLGSRPTDSQLWTHAQQNDLAIVTKDADCSRDQACREKDIRGQAGCHMRAVPASHDLEAEAYFIIHHSPFCLPP